MNYQVSINRWRRIAGVMYTRGMTISDETLDANGFAARKHGYRRLGWLTPIEEPEPVTEMPGRSDSAADWKAYAATVGVDPSLSKAKIMQAVEE